MRRENAKCAAEVSPGADGSPKAAKDLWAILTKAGVPRYAEIISFAEEPGDAAANYFILKLMGYPDLKVQTM